MLVSPVLFINMTSQAVFIGKSFVTLVTLKYGDPIGFLQLLYTCVKRLYCIYEKQVFGHLKTTKVSYPLHNVYNQLLEFVD